MTWANAKEWGWKGVSLFALLIMAAALVFALVALPEAGVDTTPTTDDRARVVLPQNPLDVQPANIACNAERVVVSQSPLGQFYRAVLGPYTLGWTDSPETGDKFAVTNGELVVHLDADKKAIDCLRKKAVPARTGE